MIKPHVVPRATFRVWAFLPWIAVVGMSACDEPTRPVPVATIEVTAPSKFLDVGESLQLSATALDDSGNTISGTEFTWSSSDEQVASVVVGLITGKAPGRARIIASADGKQGEILVTVEVAAAALEIAPSTKSTIAVGTTSRIVANTRDSSGKQISHSMIYSSSDTLVAAVSDSGFVRGKAPGSTTITVSAGSKSAKVTMAVERPYTLTYLGVQANSEYQPLDINEAGQIVGWSAAVQAFLWQNGQMTSLGNGSALAINDKGDIAGSNGSAVVWRNGTPIVVYSKSAGGASASGINNHGHVVGSWHSDAVGPGSRRLGTVFLYRDGSVTELIPSATNAEARAINDAGWVVADTGSYYPNYSRRAVLFRNGESLRIGAGTIADKWELTAHDINNHGQVVGGPYNAYVWKDGLFTNLDPTPNQLISEARSINDEGVIVG